MIVNLALDRMATTPPARSADVISAIIDRPYVYAEGARKIGLTSTEYREFRDALVDGGALYVVLPRHIDAMAGAHHGRAYALRHVVVPAGTMGWRVNLRDGVTVLVPRACGNLSMNGKPHTIAVAHRKQPHRVRAASYQGYFQPVVFASPAPAVGVAGPVADVPITESAPVAVAPAVAPQSHGIGAAFLAPLWPVLASFVGGGSTPVAPCSLGSNEQGVCHL